MKDQRVIYLDAVRGIASIIVVFSHYFSAFYPALLTFDPKQSHTVNNIESSIGSTPANILYNGTFAVCVFFLLSGNVLSLRFFRDNNIESIYSGAFKRYFRLAIPVFFSVLISYLLFILNAYYNQSVGKDTLSNWLPYAWANSLDSFSAMLYDGTFKAMFVGGNSEYNMVLWTMNIEFFGSLFVFAFLALCGNLKNRWIIYLILICIFWNSLYLSFVLGMLLCEFYNHWLKIKMHWIINLFMACIAIYISSFRWGTIDNFYENNNTKRIYIVVAFLALFVVLNSSLIKHVFSKRLFSYLGKLSFSIYLLHMLILGSASCYLFELFKKGFQWSYHLSFFIMFAISILILWLSSHIFYKLIDKNAIRFSKYVYNKFFLQRIHLK